MILRLAIETPRPFSEKNHGNCRVVTIVRLAPPGARSADEDDEDDVGGEGETRGGQRAQWDGSAGVLQLTCSVPTI